MLLVPCLFPTFPLFAYSNVLTSWKNNTNVGEFSNIYCVKKVIRNVRPVFLHRKPSPFWCQGQENWHFSNLSSQWCDDMDMGNCCHCIYALSYATNSTGQTQIPNSFKHWKKWKWTPCDDDKSTLIRELAHIENGKEHLFSYTMARQTHLVVYCQSLGWPMDFANNFPKKYHLIKKLAFTTN